LPITDNTAYQASLTLDQLRAHGAGDSTKLWDVEQRLRCPVCGRQNADVQPDWSQKSREAERASTWGMMPPTELAAHTFSGLPSRP
jgi:hypothetical protein